MSLTPDGQQNAEKSEDRAAGISGVPTGAMDPEGHAAARLSSVIDDNRKRWKLIVILEALGLGVSVTLGYLWLVFIIDHTVHLPQAARIVSLAVFIACVGWLALSLYRRWRMFDMTVDQVALAIEKRTPGGLGNRLINALQLARASDAGQGGRLVARHVVEENIKVLEGIRLKQARALRPALARLAVAGAVVFAGLGMWAFNRSGFEASVARMFDPMGNHDPAYRTRMTVLPGDTQARPGQNVTLTIELQGKVPQAVEISQAAGDKRQSHLVAINPEAVVQGKENKAVVRFTLLGLAQTTKYRVIAGDHQSEVYTIQVPEAAQVHGFVSTVTPPEYAGLATKKIEAGTGDIEALEGSQVEMVVKTVGAPKGLTLRYLNDPQAEKKRFDLPGKVMGPGSFSLNFAVVNDVAYKIVLSPQEAGQQGEQETARYTMRAIADLPARAELVTDPAMLGIGSGQKYKWQVKASDDLGLSQVGFFAREAAGGRAEVMEGTALDVEGQGWQMVRAWPMDLGVKKGTYEYQAAMAELGFVDGQDVELVPAASDRRPDRLGTWIAGAPVTVTLGGAARALEVEYEMILKVEARLAAHIQAQEALHKKAVDARKVFDAKERKDSEAWQKTLAELTQNLAREEAGFGKQVLLTMRAMPESAQHMRASLGMVNDTDVRTSVQGMEAVTRQQEPQQSLAAYNLAVNAMSRSAVSLGELQSAFTAFRQRWEDQNMAGMVKFLADRQSLLRDDAKLASMEPGADMGRTLAAFKTRQTHLAGLTALVSQGLTGVAQRLTKTPEPDAPKPRAEIVSAYETAGQRLKAPEMVGSFVNADRAIDGRDFQLMGMAQEQAAAWLTQTYLMLKNAHGMPPQVAMVEPRGEKQGTGKVLGDAPADNGVTYADVDGGEAARQPKPGEVPGAGKTKATEPKVNDYKMTPEQVASLDTGGGAKPPQDLEILKLGEKPSGQVRFPGQSDREPNQVAVTPQMDMGDVAGPLIPEEPNTDPNYDRNHLNSNARINEPGEIGKQGGDVNSNVAAAPTGNNIPPANEIGGTSRDGTKDSRATGRNISQTANDRRGLDKPQEGSQSGERFPGEIKRVRFTQKDVEPSAGDSGTTIKGEDRNHFAMSNDGQWKTEMSKHMGEPQKENRVVESVKPGSRFDPQSLKDMYVDLEKLDPADRERLSKFTQTVKMMRTVQKDLSRVFMAPPGLEEALKGLEEKLAQLEHAQADSDFRMRAQGVKPTEKGRLAMAGGAAFQGSPARRQGVRGRVLDEPAWAVLPGYEGVAEVYYQKLAEGE